MLNLFTRTMPWMVASLVAATSIFGQSSQVAAADNCRPKPAEPPKACPVPKCPPKPCCEPVPQIQLIPAYNAPARVDVRGCWDIYAGASFIYWQAMQDDMDFAMNVDGNSNFGTGAGDISTGYVKGHDFEYKPGFKVLLGMNFDHDNWDGYVEYTWLHSTTSTSVSKDEIGGVITNTSTQSTTGNPALIDGEAFNSASQEWKLRYQALDAALARTYYVGTKLTFRSFFGARFAWFTQYKDIDFSGDGTGTPASFNGTYGQRQNFASWGAGLLGGLNTNWMLGEGFRMIGNGSVDILYTRVQTVNSKEQLTAAGAAPATFNFMFSRPDFLMPHGALEYGFGWDSYFDCNNWHIDLAATYNFQVFWDANLFRESFDDTTPSLGRTTNSNLYMHGLTVSAKLDF